MLLVCLQLLRALLKNSGSCTTCGRVKAQAGGREFAGTMTFQKANERNGPAKGSCATSSRGPAPFAGADKEREHPRPTRVSDPAPAPVAKVSASKLFIAVLLVIENTGNNLNTHTWESG